MNLLEKNLETENLAVCEAREIQEVRDAGLKDSEETLRVLEKDLYDTSDAHTGLDDASSDTQVKSIENIKRENISEESRNLNKTEETRNSDSLKEEDINEFLNRHKNVSFGSYTPGQCAKVSTGTQMYCPLAGSGR